MLWFSWLVEFWELWNNYTVRWGVTDRGGYEWLIGTGRWKLVWWGGLTRGGQSPLRTPSGRQSPCSPHYGAHPIRSAGTPGHPVDYRNTRRLILSKTFHLDCRNGLCKEVGGGLLAADEFGSILLDLAPEIWGTDGLVVHRRPQALSQLCKLWDSGQREEK